MKNFKLIMITLCAALSMIASGTAGDMALGRVASINKLRLNSYNSFGRPGAQFTFAENSRVFFFNGVRMPLGFPMHKRQGRLYLNNSDYEKHIKPLLAKQTSARKLRVVAIDAGHGGADVGATSVVGGLQEKNLNLDVALKLANLLQAKGYRPVLIRQSDKKIDLKARTEIANRVKADLFICVHFNSAPSKGASGIEVFTLTPFDQPSSYKQKKPQGRARRGGNRFDALNTVLGYHLQSSLLKVTRSDDRGVKHAEFSVLRELNCPGALVECGFLSNFSESKKIASSGYREILAQAICQGIIDFDRATRR